jgi:hypothetical protein
MACRFLYTKTGVPPPFVISLAAEENFHPLLSQANGKGNCCGNVFEQADQERRRLFSHPTQGCALAFASTKPDCHVVYKKQKIGYAGLQGKLAPTMAWPTNRFIDCGPG